MKNLAKLIGEADPGVSLTAKDVLRIVQDVISRDALIGKTTETRVLQAIGNRLVKIINERNPMGY